MYNDHPKPKKYQAEETSKRKIETHLFLDPGFLGSGFPSSGFPSCGCYPGCHSPGFPSCCLGPGYPGCCLGPGYPGFGCLGPGEFN
ncbi:21945_t:CDS:2 [Dentiscutata erythropus]|uniref:21945_t:CDS:1 n=1 Tax=Dentiscutata erythropus TaxID=1348616 RepID=A0A9N9EXA1_9GLOM|nr:21945_t:CDS:2 [Dentiscutata erythropus]